MSKIASPIKTMLSSRDFDLVKQGLSLLAATDPENFGCFTQSCYLSDDGELVIAESGDSMANLVSVTHRSSATILANARLGRFEGLKTLKLLDLEGFANLSLIESSSSLTTLVFRAYREDTYGTADSMGGLAFVEHFPNLEKLVLDAVVDFENFKCESECASLKSLSLRTFIGDSLSNLSFFPSLERLKIASCSSSFVSLSLLPCHEYLASLSLGDCRWLRDLSGLNVCKDLESLTLLELTDMPANELAVIRALPSLTDLSLSGPASMRAPDNVFDSSMKLERLSIGDNAVLVGGLLEHLLALPSLEEVEFQGNLYINGGEDEKNLNDIMQDIPRVRIDNLGWRPWLAFVEVLMVLHEARTWDDARPRLLTLGAAPQLLKAVAELSLSVRPLSVRYGNKDLREITKDIADDLRGNVSLFFIAMTWQIQGVFPDSLDLRDMGITDLTPLRHLLGLKSVRLDQTPREYTLEKSDFGDLEQLIIDSDVHETDRQIAEVEGKNAAQDWLSRCRQLEV